jgi:hypothetical protein
MKTYKNFVNLSGWNKVMSNKIIFALVLTLLFTTVGSAASVNVAANYNAIQTAIDSASDGDEIIVADGTVPLGHGETFDTDGKAITIRSANGAANCTINCQGVTRAFIFESYENEATVIDGFTIQNGSAISTTYGGPYGGAIECYMASPTIKNCIIANCSADFGGAIDIFYGSPLIQNCVIRNNTANYDGSAIECAGEDAEVEIINCLVYGNGNSNGFGALDFYSGCVADIINCTITDNTGTDNYGGVYAANSDVTVRNSILWNNGTSAGGIVTVSHSCIEYGHSGSGNISSDPMFKIGTYGNYYLSQISAGQLNTSRCVDAGDVNAVSLFDSTYTTNTYDFSDTGKVDMGYHYNQCGCGGGGGGTPLTYTLVTIAEPDTAGAVTPSYPLPGTEYMAFSEVEISAAPFDSYRFNEWRISGISTYNSGIPATYTVPSDHNDTIVIQMTEDNILVAANFNSQQMYKVNTFVKGGSGAITSVVPTYPDLTDPCSFYIPQNSNAAITATASAGYVVDKWYVGDSNVFDINNANTYSVYAASGLTHTLTTPIDDNKTIAVEFKVKTFLLTTGVMNGNGTIAPKRALYHPAGSIVNLTATPNTGYRVHEWYVDTAAMGKWNETTFSVVMDANKVVIVEFEPGVNRVITVSPGGDIQGAINDANNGDTVKLSPGTYVGTGFDIPTHNDPNLDKSITIVGDPQNPQNVVIDCEGEIAGGIAITSTKKCTLNGITITNSYTKWQAGRNASNPSVGGGGGSYNLGGALLLASADHKVLNCRINNITAVGADGGEGADANETIVNGSYGGDGGWAMGAGIFILSGSPYIANTIVEDCVSQGGNGGNAGDGRNADAPDPNVGKGGQGGLGGPAYGAGVACWAYSSPTFENCIIRNCQAIGGLSGNGGNSGRGYTGGYGGLATNSDAWAKGRTDANGWGGSNTGVSVVNNDFAYVFDPVSGKLVLDANMIDISDYATKGGAAYVGRFCNVKFIKCTFTGNTTEGCVSGLGGNSSTGIQNQPRKNYHMPSYGSAVFSDANSTTKFIECEVYDNEIIVSDKREGVVSESDDYGGGSLASNKAFRKDVNECTIYENFAPTGGGIYSDTCGALYINDCNILNNYSYSGGGIMTIDSKGQILKSQIRQNNAGTVLNDPNQYSTFAIYGSGGGIYAFSSKIDVNECIIYNNAANAVGGGICMDGDYYYAPLLTPTLHNCLITENRAGYNGGGIAATLFAQPKIQNCTISKNTVTDIGGLGGGIYASYSAYILATDNIIWENTGVKGSQIGLSSGGAYTNQPASMKISYSDIDLRARAGLAASSSSSASTTTVLADRLIDASTIYNEINTNGTAKVIVTLADVDFETDWSSTASVSMTQNAVAYRQNKVLSSLEAGTFTVRHKLQNAAIFSGSVTAAGLTSLLNNSTVAHIEPVRKVSPALAQAMTMGKALNTRSQYNGQNCAIAIVDTGVDYTHPRLGGGSFPNSKVIGGYDFGDNDADPMPMSDAHGTACAGIAAGNLGTVGDYIGGVAYGAKIYAMKMGGGSADDLSNDAGLKSWDWCLTHKDDNTSYPIRVISNSWCIYDLPFDNTEEADALFPAFATMAQRIVNAGITILAASGNDSFAGQGIAWPSAMSNVISVGAVYDTTGKVTEYSNSADNLDILAPADPVYTTDIVGSGGYNSGDYYPSFNGTSSACPFAAGCVAALQSAAIASTGSPLSPAEVENVLKATGTSVTDTKVAVTKPMVNLESAIAMLSDSSPIYRDDTRCSIIGAAQNSDNSWTVQGSTNISADPNFVLGYYLSNIDAGQSITSLCVDAGSVFAIARGLNTYTTRTDGENDIGYVDMGYHYTKGLPVYNLVIDVNTTDANGYTSPSVGTHKKYEGDSVTITAVPDANSRVKAWIIDGATMATNSRKYTITMYRAHTVTVVFEKYTKRSIVVPDQYGTIQEAIDAAESGDIIYVYPKPDGKPHYIEDTEGLDFEGKAITIRSRFPDDPNTVAQAIIDCNNRGRAFIFQNGEDSNSIIEGLTIVNGMASGPIATGTQIVPNPEDANIYQRDGIDASGDGYGGAIYVGKNTSPTIRKCVFTACMVTGGQGSDGGRGYNISSTSTLERGGFGGKGGNGSGSGYGGAIFCGESSAPSVLYCKFNENEAHGGIGGDGGDGGNGASGKTAGDGGDGGNGSGNGYGGAIYCSTKSAPKILGCSFRDNLGGMGIGGIGGVQGLGQTPTQPPYPYDGSAGLSSGTGFGGAIYYVKGANVDINDCQILNGDTIATTGDTLGSGGGAIYCEPALAGSKILNSTLAGNKASAGRGGAIFLGAGNKLVLNNCYLGGNSANTYGGAIFVGSPKDANTCQLVFNDCVFTSNTAQSLGGGIYAKNTDANLVECFVNRNTAYSGGGLYMVSTSKLRFIGGTINDNNAVGTVEAQGGGAMIMHLPAEFVNCQFIGNSSSYAGGGLMLNGTETADSNIINCLFAKNKAAVRGGAIVTSLDSSPVIRNCTFSENEAAVGGKGGAIFCTFRSSPDIRYNIFDKNRRVAIYENSIDCAPFIYNNLFNNNYHGDYYKYTKNTTFKIATATDKVAELLALNDDTAGENLADTSVHHNEIELFRTGSLGDYYLRQKTADYNDTSCMAINAGIPNAADVTVFNGKTMANYTTRTDSYRPDAEANTYDINELDLGFHYKDANDAAKLYLTTTVAGGKGTISPASGSVYRGTTVQLKAAPTTGWRVKQWTGTDNDSTTSTTNYVVMMTDRTVSVEFEQPRNLYLPAGYATLQEAINDSADGDKIIVSPGTYQYYDTNYDMMNGPTIDGKRITITSTNPDDPCVVAATVFKGGIFRIENVDSSMIIDGITIRDTHWVGTNGTCPSAPISPDGRNGTSLLGGAMRISNASPTIRNVMFINCAVGGGDGSNNCSTGGDGGWGGYARGGAVGIDSGSSPIFKNCSFIGCYAHGGNGGNGDPSAQTPGHGGSWGDPNGSIGVTWDYADGRGGDGSYMPYWYYTGQGGAVYCSTDTYPVFENCVFTDNYVVGGVCGTSGPVWAWPQHKYVIDSFGGAVYMAAGSTADFTGCTFTDNFGDTRNQIADANVPSMYGEGWVLSDNVVSYGGAIYAESAYSIPTIKDCVFSNNTACAGGALNIEDSIFQIRDSSFFNNTAMIGGSMLYIGSDSLLSECDFLGNSAVEPAGQGGAIYSAASAPKIYDSRLLYNSASFSGGACYFTGSLEPNMHNCLIAHNQATTYGGGLSANFDVQLHLSSCTVAKNQASGSVSFGGGLNCAYNGNTTVINSIFWENEAQNGRQIAIGNNYSAADKQPAEVTVTYSNIQGGGAGIFCDRANGCLLYGFDEPSTNLYGTSLSDPQFRSSMWVTTPWNGYFLAAPDINDSNGPGGMQTANNMCIDSGFGTAIDWNMYKHTTRTDRKVDVADSNIDLGYHYIRPQTITGDFNFDGIVNERDLELFLQKWMYEDCVFPYYCNGRDFTEDGEVDFEDYAVFADYYQETEKIPPQPNPMTWATSPKSAGATSIKMTATTATDNSSDVIEYYFECTYGGGPDSPGWIADSNFTATGLTTGNTYGYRVMARDGRDNRTGWSVVGYAKAGSDSIAPTPDPMTWATVPTLLTSTSATMTATTATDTSGVEYYFDEVTGNPGGTDSGWISTTTYTDDGLAANTTYTYRVKARDKSDNYNETAFSVERSVTTPSGGDSNSTVDTAAPTPDPGVWVIIPTVSGGSPWYYHTMQATTATDATPPIYYYFDCIEDNNKDSGWILTPYYQVGPLGSVSNSTYRYKTKDSLGNESGWSPAINTYTGD